MPRTQHVDRPEVERPAWSSGPFATRFLGRHFWSNTPHDTLADSVVAQRRSFEKAAVIVRAFYAVGIYWTVSATNQWPGYRQLTQAHPQWPARWWFDWFAVRTSVDIIYCAYLGTAILVLLMPQKRLLRAVYAISLLEYMAFVNGFDKINHDMHGWLFVSFVLILLPGGSWRERRSLVDRQFFLTVFWAAQTVVLFFYTLTGLWKINFAIRSAVVGHNSAFNFSGFSYIVANRLLQSPSKTVLGNYFSRTELLGWALFLGTMYLESASLIIAFRPRLQRIWGASLIFFHLGTQLAMGFTFGPNIVLVGLLFVCSPFAPARIDVRATFLDLPVIHFAKGRWDAWRHRPRTTEAEPSPPPQAEATLA